MTDLVWENYGIYRKFAKQNLFVTVVSFFFELSNLSVELSTIFKHLKSYKEDERKSSQI